MNNFCIYRRGYLSLQTELKSVQSSAEDMMVCQGAQVSEASIALTNLTSRMQIITGKLIQDYSISENDLEVRKIKDVLILF